jgi:hypothetical protein
MIEVLLSRDDMARCERHRERHREARQVEGFVDDPAKCGWAMLRGPIGELALAKWLGVPWDGEDGHGARLRIRQASGLRDVGRIEVKSIDAVANGLLVPKKTSDPIPRFAPVVLAYVDQGQRYLPRLLGWARADEVCQPQHWRGDIAKPAWIMGQRYLAPIATLVDQPEVAELKGAA